MRIHFNTLIIVVLSMCIIGCKSTKESTVKEKERQRAMEQTAAATEKKETKQDRTSLLFNERQSSLTTQALPNIIIYKTKNDYSKNVPVKLNDEKTAIISYPGSTDVHGQTPVPLMFEFLLDRRGINQNVAFLRYTYEEYEQMKPFPSISVLYSNIIDKDPLIEAYYCGKKSDFKEDLVSELNNMLIKCGGKPEEIFKKIK